MSAGWLIVCLVLLSWTVLGAAEWHATSPRPRATWRNWAFGFGVYIALYIAAQLGTEAGR